MSASGDLQKVRESLNRAACCSNLLQLALAGLGVSDVTDDAASALQYVADELESHLNMATATLGQSRKAPA